MRAVRLSRRGVRDRFGERGPRLYCLDQERGDVLIDGKHGGYMYGSPSSERGCLLHDAGPLRTQLQHSRASLNGSAPDYD